MNTKLTLRLLILLTLGSVLAACSSKPPGCADSETLNLIREIVVDHTKKNLNQSIADDPDEWINKFFQGMKVELHNIVSEGYKEDAKKQLCRGNLKISMITGQSAERDIDFSTQRTEDKKSNFLLEIQDVNPFLVVTTSETRKYFEANRWTGTWNGNYACDGVGGAMDGPQGPYSMPVSMVVEGKKTKLERTTRGGGVEVLQGEFFAMAREMPIQLNGYGQNSPDDRWFTSFTGAVQGKQLVATGQIKTTTGLVVRKCKLELAMGSNPTPQAASPATSNNLQGFTGNYSGTGEGLVTVEIGVAKNDGKYPVELSTSAATAGGGGCGGSIKGFATASGTTLKFLGEQDGMSCEASLTFDRAGKLTVEAGKGCNDFHGAACGFSGTLEKAR